MMTHTERQALIRRPFTFQIIPPHTWAGRLKGEGAPDLGIPDVPGAKLDEYCFGITCLKDLEDYEAVIALTKGAK